MKFCNSHLTRNVFNLYMRRFFFGLVYKVKKTQSVHWFGLTELNETMGIMCGGDSSETYIANEIL